MWATCGNPAYDPNGTDWGNASSPAMMSHGHAIKLSNAKPGDLILYANHVEMFLEPYHGDSTQVVGWGSAPGHKTTLAAENVWQLLHRGGNPYY
jgi:cell wall-associated NlpC family hydrolase